MHLLLLLLAAATLNVHASSTTETIVGRVSVDMTTTQDTSDTDLIPIPTDLAESISTTHEQFCDVTMLKKAKKQSVVGQFKHGKYKFGRFVFVKVPSKIAKAAGKIAKALRFPLKCGLKGFVMDLVDHFLGKHGFSQLPSGKSAGQKAFGVITAPILLASLPFMLAAWVFGTMAEKVQSKLPESAELDAKLTLVNVNELGRSIEVELMTAYKKADQMQVEEAVEVIGAELQRPGMLEEAVKRATLNLHHQSEDASLSEAAEELWTKRSVEIQEVIQAAVRQEREMIQQQHHD